MSVLPIDRPFVRSKEQMGEVIEMLDKAGYDTEKLHVIGESVDGLSELAGVLEETTSSHDAAELAEDLVL